jgi:hypothetical protein
MTMVIERERVEEKYSPELLAAVAVLDKDQPGWWRKVDLGTFTLVGTTSCVCGQVYGVGCGIFGETVARLHRYREPFFGATSFCASSGLEPQWRSLISERQEADRIGETLSIPDLESEAVEGHERVLA